MRNLSKIETQLSDMLVILNEAQAVQFCPNHSRKEKAAYLRFAQSLAFGIEQIEWILELREHTVVDAYNAICS